MILPRTKIEPVNEWLGRAETALLPYLVTNPPLGWDQTPTGLVPSLAKQSEFIFPFKFYRASFDGDEGVFVQYGTFNSIAPDIAETGNPLVDTGASNNFLVCDFAGENTGFLYLETEWDDTDEWEPSLTSVKLKFDDTATPADSGAGTATRIVNFQIGSANTQTATNSYYNNLAALRFGQSGEPFTLYAV